MSATTPTISAVSPSASRAAMTPADAAAEPDRNIDRVEIGHRAKQFETIARDPAHQQRIVGRAQDAVLSASAQADRVFVGRLEIVPGFDEPRAEALHRPVLLDAVAVRHDDRRLEPEPRRGERDALPVIAGGRADDPANIRLRALDLVEIDEPAADLEGADRRVVLVLDP